MPPPHGHVTAEALPVALIVENPRAADKQSSKRFICERRTHLEANSSNHEITKKMRDKHYSLMWITTPVSYYLKNATKSANRIRTLAKWSKLASHTAPFISFGPPGYFWKLPAIVEAIEDLHSQRVIYVTLA